MAAFPNTYTWTYPLSSNEPTTVSTSYSTNHVPVFFKQRVWIPPAWVEEAPPPSRGDRHRRAMRLYLRSIQGPQRRARAEKPGPAPERPRRRTASAASRWRAALC